jgi:hypothetical protein
VFSVVLLLLLIGRAEGLTLATFNVENYTVADRMVDGVYRKAYPKPEKEKAAIAAAIRGIAPDILAVQEMGPQPYLDDFQRELRAAGTSRMQRCCRRPIPTGMWRCCRRCPSRTCAATPTCLTRISANRTA